MINDCAENSGFSEIEASESQMEAADGNFVLLLLLLNIINHIE